MYMHTHKETHTQTYTYIHIHICICTLPHIIPSHCKRSASCWRELASVRRNTLVCWYLCHKKYVCVCVCVRVCKRDRERAYEKETDTRTHMDAPWRYNVLRYNVLSCHVALRPLWETRLHSRECVCCSWHNIYICATTRQCLVTAPWRRNMGWLRWVGSFKWWVSFAKQPYKRDDILQKRPIKKMIFCKKDL